MGAQRRRLGGDNSNVKMHYSQGRPVLAAKENDISWLKGMGRTSVRWARGHRGKGYYVGIAILRSSPLSEVLAAEQLPQTGCFKGNTLFFSGQGTSTNVCGSRLWSACDPTRTAQEDSMFTCQSTGQEKAMSGFFSAAGGEVSVQGGGQKALPMPSHLSHTAASSQTWETCFL